MRGYITIAGPLFCFLATLLLVLVCVSAPTWNKVSFLDVRAPNGQSTQFGVFGYTGSGTTIGYRIDSANIGFADNESLSAILYRLTKILILHPLAAGLAGISIFLGICGTTYHRTGTILMIVFTAGAALLTLVAFVVDMALFGVARNHFRQQGASAQYGNANWLTLAALVALGLGFCSATCGVFRSYRGRKGSR